MELGKGKKEFDICCKFLKKLKRTKYCKVGSYFLKHLVEDECKNRVYISEDTLIAAAINLGIKYKDHSLGISRTNKVIKNFYA